MFLKFIKRSRSEVKEGDVFAMQTRDGTFLFGRVIIANATQRSAPMPGATLVYIYSVCRDSPKVDAKDLTPDRLLIAPAWTNLLGWSKGYFATVKSEPLTQSDLLAHHSFFDALTDSHMDEKGVATSKREPCGVWGLVSYAWIADRVEEALSQCLSP